jgi:thiol-disulfide isomerase/thioredoxin
MKNLPYIKFLLLFAFVAVVSCSKKESPLGPPEETLSLILTSDAGENELEVVAANQEVTFKATGSDEVDYTESSKFYVDGSEISGSTYTFTNVGTHEVKAVYNDITSNTLNFEVLAPDQRALVIDVPRALRNQTITFSLFDTDGNNTASDATFFVNNTAISGFTYSSATPGDFEVYAEYEVNGQSASSETKPFTVFVPKRKVVIEDYTGTWCGYCPAVTLAIDSVEAVTHNVVPVAIHKSSRSIPDPMDFERIGEMQDMFGIPRQGFPRAQLNRTVQWVEPYAKEDVTAMAGNDTDVSIAISSQLTGANLSVDVKVVYEDGSTTGDKVVVYLLESGIVSPQANYYNSVPGHPLEGMGNPIDDYVHNDALRNSLSDLFGDPIPEMPAFQVFEKSYTFTVPSDYVGQNLSFAVMVVDANNNAKNAQRAEINENKGYE